MQIHVIEELVLLRWYIGREIANPEPFGLGFEHPDQYTILPKTILP